jgi:NAD(P)-dependent dehydrogenase (short-subunit alcohol dehydrogenase family)
MVIGGSAGIGLETARRTRAEGTDVIPTGCNPGLLKQRARQLGALGYCRRGRGDLPSQADIAVFERSPASDDGDAPVNLS